jgi:hypothetical protein
MNADRQGCNSRVFDVVYKDVKVGEYIPDLIAFDQVVVGTKVIEKIPERVYFCMTANNPPKRVVCCF